MRYVLIVAGYHLQDYMKNFFRLNFCETVILHGKDTGDVYTLMCRDTGYGHEEMLNKMNEFVDICQIPTDNVRLFKEVE